MFGRLLNSRPRHLTRSAAPARARIGQSPTRAVECIDRRDSPRFDPLTDLLWVQWWRDGECLGRPARLVNVSRGGALVVAAFLLYPGETLRLFLEQQEPPLGIDAVVIEAVEGAQGMSRVRLRFPRPCPDRFMEAAADGFESWLAGSSRESW